MGASISNLDSEAHYCRESLAGWFVNGALETHFQLKEPETKGRVDIKQKFPPSVREVYDLLKYYQSIRKSVFTSSLSETTINKLNDQVKNLNKLVKTLNASLEKGHIPKFLKSFKEESLTKSLN